MIKIRTILIVSAILTALLFGLLNICTNNPWPKRYETEPKTLYMPINAAMKTLDPVGAGYLHESEIMSQSLEAFFQYHYLKRPYTLIPCLADSMPTPVFFDKDGNRLTEADPPADKVARMEITIHIKKGLKFQPHPAFARFPDGSLRYHNLTDADCKGIKTPNDFPEKGTREVTAEDFAVQARRLCDGRYSTVHYSTFTNFIMGMDNCSKAIDAAVSEAQAKDPSRNYDLCPVVLDYAKIPLEGVQVIDRYTIKYVCKRKYLQLLYWMAMPMFSPCAQEVLDFYGQEPMMNRSIAIDKWPVGTGPYMLMEYNPNQRMVFDANPNFRDERYPHEGAPGDSERGLLKDAGKKLPLNGRLVFNIELESIPAWVKFNQGYYENSAISTDVFNQAVNTSPSGDMTLSDDMLKKGIEMFTENALSLYFFAFNMDDPVVGGYTEEKAKLRRAISICLNYNQLIDIFLNGRAVTAQGPIPEGVFGALSGPAGTNPYTDTWNAITKKNDRLPLSYARQLMAEAGYPNGVGPDNRQLSITLQHSAGANPLFKTQFMWMRRQFAEIGIDLKEDPSDINRYRDKVDRGAFQVVMSGWVGDYPDPETFLFLFDSAQGKAKFKGQNLTNYANPEYDRYFKKLESMQDCPERFELIQKAVSILRHDAPLAFGYVPMTFALINGWMKNYKPNPITTAVYKYRGIDPDVRQKARAEWNAPKIAPVMIAWLILMMLIVPAFCVISYRYQKAEEAAAMDDKTNSEKKGA